MTELDQLRRLDELTRRLDALERDAPRNERLAEVVTRQAGGGENATTAVIRSIDVQSGTMHVQAAGYASAPAVEREIEPVGSRFRAYPIPGVHYADLVGLNLVVGGSDSDPIATTSPLVLVHASPAGKPTVYPLLHGDETELGDGPDYSDGAPDLHERLDLVPRVGLWAGVAVIELVSLNFTRVGAFDRPRRLTDTGFGIDRLRGVLRSRFQSCGFDHLGGFRYWEGGLYSPTFGSLCGKIVVLDTSGACIPVFGNTSDCACVDREPNGDETCDTDPPGHDPQCFEPEGLSCIYCAEFEDQCGCSIHEPRSGCLPCDAYGIVQRSIAAPGVRITPRTRDIFDNKLPFFANAPRRETDGLFGSLGKLLYTLADYSAAFQPVFPDPTYGGYHERGICCTWVCNFTMHYGVGAWKVTCLQILKDPPHPPTTLRPFTVLRQNDFPALVTFNLSRTSASCFRQLDQTCLTTGPDPNNDWFHVGEGWLAQLDTMNVDMSMRIAGGPKYPRRSDSWLNLANAALDRLGNVIGGLTDPGHTRQNGVASTRINLWHLQKEWQCDDAPVIGEVFVRPYGTTCLLPADLVLTYVDLKLRASTQHRGRVSGQGEQDDQWDLRTIATFDATLTLSAKLRAGWENIGTRTKIRSGDTWPTGSIEVDPGGNGVLTASGVIWSDHEINPTTDTLTLTNARDADGVSIPAADGDFVIASIQTTDLTIRAWTAGDVATVDYAITGPGCPARLFRAEGSPCDLSLRMPHTVASIFTIDADGRENEVPQTLTWRALVHTRPWSKISAPFIVACPFIDQCCEMVHALNGTVVPGVIWDTNDINGDQRNAGDVVFFVVGDPNDFEGCDCDAD